MDRIRVGQNRRRILKRAVGGEGEEEQEEEKEREGENRWRSVFVKHADTKRARVPQRALCQTTTRGFHFPISKEKKRKPFDSNRPFDARELSPVAPRVANVELASTRPHRHRCDSRSCLRVRALFYGVRRIKNPLK